MTDVNDLLAHEAAVPRPTRREAQAANTKGQIVASAHRLFLTGGYIGTSIAAIAEDAGVAVQTIYNSVGNKSALLSAVLDLAASGPDSPRTVPEVMRARARAATDVPAMISVLADWFVEVNARTAEVVRVIRQAAAVDTDAAALEQLRAQQRLRNYGEAAAGLRARGGLSSGMTDDEAAATIWAIGHPEAFRSLVIEGGRSVGEYGRWVTAALGAALA